MASAKYPASISRVNGYDDDAVTYIPVVIIGAGESGIAMGCRLKEKLGFDQFRIFDRQAGIGGTWWINRYPGVACDIPAILYSFSFAQNPRWSSFNPPGPEIARYMHDVCSKYQITDKIQCNTDVEAARWLEDKDLWEVQLRHLVPGVGDLSVKDRVAKAEREGEQSVYLGRETVLCKVLVSGVGGLVEPNAAPKNVPGWDKFKGDVFHSARWRHDIDFKDKNVVVVGTGCSAAQLVPCLTRDYGAKSVVQLMRSPPWVIPRIREPGGTEWWSKNAPFLHTYVPGLMKLVRFIGFTMQEGDWFRNFGVEEKHVRNRARVEEHLLKNMKRKVPEKYHELLTPDYGVGCKRRIFDPGWLAGFQDSRIDLTTQPLKQVNERSVTLGAGQQYPKRSPEEGPPAREVEADVIVLANGFETTRWLHPVAVKGRGGVDLVEEMERRGGPQAYQGTAMDGFPNFFFIFGPNTATGHTSVILASENMVEYSLKFIEPLLKGHVSTVEVKRSAEEAYTKDIQSALNRTVFNSGGCASWYTTGDWNGTVYPYSQIWFGLRCMFPIWSDWNIKYTTKGQIRRRAGQLIKAAVVYMAIVAFRNMYESGDGLEYFRNLAFRYLLLLKIKLSQRLG